MVGGKTRSRKGFTLVELLVVIVIIAVLVAIALPRYYQAIYDSKCSTCKSNLKQLDLALHAYYAQLPAASRTWAQVLTDAPTALFTSSIVFSGGFPVCPFGVAYTYEEVPTGSTGAGIKGVQTVKSAHFVAPAGGQWYDASDHVTP